MILAAIILKFVFLITVMVAIGLRATANDILATLQDRKLVAKILLANIVLIPILGLAVVRVFDLSTDTAVAVLFLACAPGGFIAIQFTTKVEDKVSFAAAVLFLLSIVAVVFTPVMAGVIVPREMLKTLPYLRVIGFMVVFLLLPLVAGFAVRHARPPLADALYKPLNLVSTVSFIAAVFLSMAIKKEAARTIGGAGIAAMLTLILGSMVIGWLLGGPKKAERKVLANSASMRNVALCMLIALTSFPQRNVDEAILAYVLVVIPPNLLFTIYHIAKRRRRAHAGKVSVAH